MRGRCDAVSQGQVAQAGQLILIHPRPGHPVAGGRPAVAVVLAARWEASNAEPAVASSVVLAVR